MTQKRNPISLECSLHIIHHQLYSFFYIVLLKHNKLRSYYSGAQSHNTNNSGVGYYRLIHRGRTTINLWCRLLSIVLTSSFALITFITVKDLNRFAFITTPCQLTKNAVNILVLSLRAELKKIEEWLQKEIEKDDYRKEPRILLIQRIHHKCQKESLESISEKKRWMQQP